MSEWISVKDRLPSSDVVVLIWSKEDGINSGWSLGDGRWRIRFFLPNTPTHWMPLPEPPKEETK